VFRLGRHFCCTLPVFSVFSGATSVTRPQASNNSNSNSSSSSRWRRRGHILMRCGSRRALGVVASGSTGGIRRRGCGRRRGSCVTTGRRVRRQGDARHCRQAHSTEAGSLGCESCGRGHGSGCSMGCGDSLDGLVWGLRSSRTFVVGPGSMQRLLARWARRDNGTGVMRA